MAAEPRPPRGPRTSARLRLALSYAAFLVFAGLVVLAGVYFVLRYVTAPIGPGIPRSDGLLAPNQELALLRVSLGALVSLAVIGLVGGWIIAGWVLRPLQRINEAAEIAATGRLDHRIRLSGPNDEFQQLADTFDVMLERLHDAFTAQERFAANASHELRTPLAVMATMLEVARADPENQDYRELIERLTITNQRTIGLTQALLRLSDVNAVTAASQPVDLAEIAAAVLEQHAGDAAARCLRFDADLEPAPTTGDIDLLTQLIENLVQNAIRHNLPTGGWARIATRHDRARARVLLTVENTGRCYTDDEARRLSEPFLRGTGRSRTAGAPDGYGLGLPLVARIARVHHGTLALDPGDEGGLTATLTLPDRAPGK